MTRDDDFVAAAQHYRDEHEATHGEAEQCGGPCIVLGLAGDDEYDEDGEPIRPDPHSEDWYDGYAEGQRDAIAVIDAALAPDATP